MTTFYLIRHAANDLIGRTIAGRMTGVHLNQTGRKQAELLAEALSSHSIGHVISSPLERAIETAEPLARSLALQVEVSEAFNEIDFGDWTNRSLEDLAPLELWKRWNSNRSGTRIPNGETILEVQNRFVAGMQQLRGKSPNACLAIFSHGDPIRAALAYYLGMPVDVLQRIQIDPASFSIIHVNDWGPEVLCMNRIVGDVP